MEKTGHRKHLLPANTKMNNINCNISRFIGVNYIILMILFIPITKQDSVILGSGGSNSWRGSMRKHCAGIRTHAEEAHMQMDFYLGTQQKILS